MIHTGKPTHEDATLLLQIAQWGATAGVSDASQWVWSEEFLPDYDEFTVKYPLGSEGFGNASKICGYFETIGTFHKHGLINEDLLFDWLLITPIWERLKGFALGMREEVGDARLYENFEALSEAQTKG